MATDDREIIQLLREIRDLLADRRSDVGQVKKAPVPAKGKAKEQPNRVEEAVPGGPAIERLLRSRVDHAKWEVVWEHGKPLDKWLAALMVAEEELGAAAALTAADIARLLVERFRVAGVHGTNVNRDLKNARSYVTRTRRGTHFEHTLNRRGITYIAARRDELVKREKD